MAEPANTLEVPDGSNLGEPYQILQIQSSAPYDERKHCPKHVELTWNNKLIYIAHLVGYFHSCITMHGFVNVKSVAVLVSAVSSTKRKAPCTLHPAPCTPHEYLTCAAWPSQRRHYDLSTRLEMANKAASQPRRCASSVNSAMRTSDIAQIIDLI
jgi:hypothetical protein